MAEVKIYRTKKHSDHFVEDALGLPRGFTMIERVARAIDPGVWENWDNWVALKGYDDAEKAEEFTRSTSLHQSLARAEGAVKAMRDPDHDMTGAVLKPGEDRTFLVSLWQGMIDAALTHP